MRKIITFLIVFTCLIVESSISIKGQRIVYYQQEKIILLPGKKEIQGKHHQEGMFMTFNQYGCYDSDQNGYDVGNGFREIATAGEKTTLYIGDSFWGDGAIYKVTHDKSRINITVGNKIYVYTRSNVPVGVTTCRLIKTKGESNSGILLPNNVISNDIDHAEISTSNNAAYYQNRYNQMEQSLISDIKTFEQTMSGSYDSSRSSMATSIRQAQKNMVDWRNIARKNGVLINASPWENVQVQIGTIHYQKKY